MSGHSKWHTIKHKKGALGAKRGKLFTKLIRELATAARMGGGDVSANPRLRLAVEKARSANMPKDTLTRAIQRGTGGGEDTVYEEVVYEGYGPGGTAVLVEGLTDNRNRTVSEVRNAFTKAGASLGAPGCVAHLFAKRGQIAFERQGLDGDALLEAGFAHVGAGQFHRDRMEVHGGNVDGVSGVISPAGDGHGDVGGAGADIEDARGGARG